MYHITHDTPATCVMGICLQCIVSFYLHYYDIVHAWPLTYPIRSLYCRGSYDEEFDKLKFLMVWKPIWLHAPYVVVIEILKILSALNSPLFDHELNA